MGKHQDHGKTILVEFELPIVVAEFIAANGDEIVRLIQRSVGRSNLKPDYH